MITKEILRSVIISFSKGISAKSKKKKMFLKDFVFEKELFSQLRITRIGNWKERPPVKFQKRKLLSFQAVQIYLNMGNGYDRNKHHIPMNDCEQYSYTF